MATSTLILEQRPDTLTKQPVCCACNVMMAADKAVIQIHDAVFCEDCWHSLPMHDIELVAQAVALRGVPLS